MFEVSIVGIVLVKAGAQCCLTHESVLSVYMSKYLTLIGVFHTTIFTPMGLLK